MLALCSQRRARHASRRLEEYGDVFCALHHTRLAPPSFDPTLTHTRARRPMHTHRHAPTHTEMHRRLDAQDNGPLRQRSFTGPGPGMIGMGVIGLVWGVLVFGAVCVVQVACPLN